jgi:hypothetical protein
MVAKFVSQGIYVNPTWEATRMVGVEKRKLIHIDSGHSL